MSSQGIWVMSLLLFTFTALSIALPWRWIRHIILAYGLALALFYTFLPPTHATHQGFGYLMAMTALSMLILVTGLPLFLRLCRAISRGTCDYTIKTWLDWVMALLTGAALSLMGFILLAFVLAGTSIVLAHGIALTLAIFVGAKWHPIFHSFAIGFVAMTLYSLTYPNTVRTAASERAPNGYMLSSASSNLTFLSMAKFPHPRLHFEEGDRTVTLGWSYRRRAFLPIWH